MVAVGIGDAEKVHKKSTPGGARSVYQPKCVAFAADANRHYVFIKNDYAKNILVVSAVHLLTPAGTA
jgi:hypothetical protein